MLPHEEVKIYFLFIVEKGLYVYSSKDERSVLSI